MTSTPISISTSYSDALVQQRFAQSSPQQKSVQPSETSTQTADTVQISDLVQVIGLAAQGESASAIAGITGLPIGEVENDLGVSTTVSKLAAAASANVTVVTPSAPTQKPASPAVAAAKANSPLSVGSLSIYA